MGEDRRGDWERGVDENLASLNMGSRVTDQELENIELRLHDSEQRLHGDSESGTSGLLGRTELLEHICADLREEMRHVRQNMTGYVDAAGTRHPGLEKRIEDLEGRETSKSLKWNFMTNVITQTAVVLVAIISLLGLLITNWDRIQAYLTRKDKDPVDQAIERAIHPKAKHRHLIIKEPDNE